MPTGIVLMINKKLGIIKRIIIVETFLKSNERFTPFPNPGMESNVYIGKLFQTLGWKVTYI